MILKARLLLLLLFVLSYWTPMIYTWKTLTIPKDGSISNLVKQIQDEGSLFHE